MIRLEDIHSLTDFQRNSKEHIARLKKTHRPSVLTVNGHAEAVVLDPQTYQKMVDTIDQADAAARVARGYAQAQRGEGRPAREVFEELRKKLNIPARPR
jgi:PHD/YefM family antitoxin component YafN of YafNO toxin-antitoxin module